MKNNSGRIGDLQFTRQKKRLNSVLMICFAFAAELLTIYQLRSQTNITISDAYVLNPNITNITSYMMIWMIPIYNAVVCGKQFNSYRMLEEKLFTRIERPKFIIRRALKSWLYGFAYTSGFYMLCALFLIIMMKTINPSIGFSPLLNTNSTVLFPYAYFAHPFLYLSAYVIVISAFGGVFAMLGFYLSIKIKNNAAVMIMPVLIAILFSLISSLSYRSMGMMFDYSNIVLLVPARLRYFSNEVMAVCGICSPMLFSVILFMFIKRAAYRDIL